MKRGYIVDETRAMTDDEDFKWRGHKSGNKQKGQSAQNAIVIEHAVITTDPVPIKVLSESSAHCSSLASSRISMAALTLKLQNLSPQN